VQNVTDIIEDSIEEGGDIVRLKMDFIFVENALEGDD
jgi:hypothetical protein